MLVLVLKVFILLFLYIQTLPAVIDQAATPPSDLLPSFPGPNEVRSNRPWDAFFFMA